MASPGLENVPTDHAGCRFADDSSRSSQCVVLLPNAERAVIDDAKVRDYLLSPSHPVGRFKSVFFVALGFSDANWQLLRDALLALARSAETLPGQPSPFGQKFEVRATLRGPSGRQAQVVTVWLVATGRDFAHFVTAFPD
jgi:hypothetical protein